MKCLAPTDEILNSGRFPVSRHPRLPIYGWPTDQGLCRLLSLLLLVSAALMFCMGAPLNAAEDDAVSSLRLEESDATITLLRNDRPIIVYNKQSPPLPAGIDSVYQRSGFLHPVFSPAGQTVTAAFPWDHPHQNGVFSAWVKTVWNGRKIDFWNLAGGTGRVIHQRVVSKFSNPSSAGFEVDLVHRAQLEPVTDILRERWKISATATEGSYHCFDLETTQTAITDVPLTVRQHRYGGIALRGPTRWLQGNVKEASPGNPETREESNFLNDLGSDRIKGNHQKARWVILSGLIDGRAAAITVLCHPDNFRAPQPARLHPSKPYFCFAPCVEGEFIIDKDHPFQAKYRFLVTDAVPETKWLEEQFQMWSRE